ncbi:MAG: FAD-dependent thymidylate synthase [Patescibacteria group bacterium]|nr:FAD-dependent thymidylate synthase [Patescibacteria group bacterium]
MDKKTLGYKPDFSGESWTAEELAIIEPFASDPKGLVSVLTNLPPEITGALCSRASRASGSLLKVLLKEYLDPILEGEDRKLAGELRDTIAFLKNGGFKNILNNQRAQAFYAKWLSQYGDDSIAQMTGTHIVFWGISQVAMKFLEDRRIGLEPIEKSTRYVNFGNKIGGRYLYYIPKPDLEKHGLLKEYTETMDHLFDTYVKLLPPLVEWLKANFDDKESVLEKKAFDTLRGLLPMATLGQVAFRGNAQALEYVISRTLKSPIGELRWIANAMKTELDKEIPSLLLRLNEERSQEYQDYLVSRPARVREALNELESKVDIYRNEKPEVRLVDFDPQAEDKILTAILFPESHASWESVARTVAKLSNEEKDNVFEAYLGGRKGRWYKTGRALENSFLRFEVTMNIGAYRDLQRHRMMTQERQRFSTHHGFDLPPEIKEAGMEKEFSEALERTHDLFVKLEALDPDLAQYVVPLAYRMRFYQYQNIRQAFWESELRTISQGHPDYRFIEQEKYKLVKEQFPRIAKYMLVDMQNYAIARRNTEERIAAKERDLVEKLKKRNQS